MLHGTSGFRFGKEAFFVLARKSRGCAEAYMGTPHKKPRRLTPPGGKRTLSGRKLTELCTLKLSLAIGKAQGNQVVQSALGPTATHPRSPSIRGFISGVC